MSSSYKEDTYEKRNSANNQFALWRYSIIRASVSDEGDDSFKKTGAVNFGTGLENVSMYDVSDCILTKKQTETLSTFVPDELINTQDFLTKKVDRFCGVLLFADVSGFTSLCEIYGAAGKSGTYRLTATLNAYIGSMVEVIYAYGGDVIKFSGDALLAVWRVKKEQYIYNVVHETLTCAMFIQHALGSYKTDVKVLLKVKLAVAAGNVKFSVIGDNLSRTYILIGSPVLDVKEAEHTCVAGDVVLAHSAWAHCSPRNYVFIHKDERNVKILRILFDPKEPRRKIFNFCSQYSIDVDKRYKMSLGLQQSGEKLEPDSDPMETKINKMRPCVASATKKGIGSFLRRYIISPVVQQIDADQSLDYLTEMRQITTMFINIIPAIVPAVTLIEAVDEAYMAICGLVHKSMGVVNKVCMFDKDIMFLVVFGLRGSKQELETQEALKCAYKIQQTVKTQTYVKTISIGVTVGTTYCGVVGHALRQEYTIIGTPVNKAARIMCAYPGKVTCDHSAFFYSRLSQKFFIVQEVKVLKGIGTVGKIYEYTEDERRNNAVVEEHRPLLGRIVELQLFKNMISEKGKCCGLIIYGEPRIGKSRLLDEFATVARTTNMKPVLIALSNMYTSVPFYVMGLVLDNVLKMRKNAANDTKEERIFKMLSSAVNKDDLFLLNDVLHAQFPASTQKFAYQPEKRHEKMFEVFRDFVKETCQNIVVLIDDAQHMDAESWELFSWFIESRSGFTVLTLWSDNWRGAPEQSKAVTGHALVQKIRLAGFDSDLIAPLSCQILEVAAISLELNKILITKCQGNPGLCQSYLVSLIEGGNLKVVEVTWAEVLKSNNYIHPEKKFIKRLSTVDHPSSLTFDEKIDTLERNDKVWVAVIQGDIQLEEKIVPTTMDGVMMAAFDCLSPYEQLLLKCGSVLGDKFTRPLLVDVMRNPAPEQTAKAVKRLFEMQLLGCVNALKQEVFQSGSVFTGEVASASFTVSGVKCGCRSTHDEFQETSGLPKYAFCQLIYFKIPQFRNTAYELLPMNQRREFHTRAVKFLESEPHMCGSCGGQSFSVTSTSPIASHSVSPKSTAQNIFSVTSASKRWHEMPLCSAISNSDFQHCKCQDIFTGVYQQLIYHCSCAGMKKKQVAFLIEYAVAAIFLGHNTLALKLLEDAEKEIRAMSSENVTNKYIIQMRLNLGKIHALQGEALFDLGSLDEAHTQLMKGLKELKIYKSRFPKLVCQKCTALGRQTCTYATHFCNERAACLNTLCNLYMVRDDWHSAKITATKALRLVQKANMEQSLVRFYAYTNFMDVCCHCGNYKHCKKIEKKSIEECQSIQKLTSAKQLLIIGEIYSANFKCRSLRGELSNSLDVGLIAFQISSDTKAHAAKLVIIALLVKILLKLKILKEAVKLMNELQFMMITEDYDYDTSCTWHALCLDFLLDAGVCIQSYDNSKAFTLKILSECGSRLLTRTPVRLLITNHWLWSLRFKYYTEADSWEAWLRPNLKEIFDDALLIDIRYYECMLLLLSHKMALRNEKSADDIINLTYLCNLYTKKLGKYVTVHNKMLLPRFLHLRAYYYKIKGNNKKARKYLRLSTKQCVKQENTLEKAWIERSREAWYNPRDNFQKAWIWNNRANHKIHWPELKNYINCSEALFSLPLPMRKGEVITEPVTPNFSPQSSVEALE